MFNIHFSQIRPHFNSDGSHNFGLTTRRLSSAITDGFIINAPANEITFSSFEGVQRERESLLFSLPPRFRGNKVQTPILVVIFVIKLFFVKLFYDF